MKYHKTFNLGLFALLMFISMTSILCQERNRIAFAELGYSSQGFIGSGAIKVRKNVFLKGALIYQDQKQSLITKFKYYFGPSINLHFENPNKKISPFASIGVGHVAYASSFKTGTFLGFSTYENSDVKKSMQFPIMFGVKFDAKEDLKCSFSYVLDNASFKPIYGASICLYIEKGSLKRMFF